MNRCIESEWMNGWAVVCVWCRLTLFVPSPWSEHYVEPVWRRPGDATGRCAGHRLAWSGWLEEDPAAGQGVDEQMELSWLRGRLDARLAGRPQPALYVQG